MAADEGQSFFFLFRTDKGRVDRAVWWRGTVPLACLAVAATVGWVLLKPYAHHDLSTEPFLAPATVAAFAYLLLYAFALILIGVCEYNLSAKRFRDRGRPAELAAVLPLSLLFGSAVIWFIPRSFGSVPDWAAPVVVAALVGVAGWNVVELGVVAHRAAP